MPFASFRQEAVEVALKHEDIALAKRSACKPPDTEKRLRQKLWLRIVEHQATFHVVSVPWSIWRVSK